MPNDRGRKLYQYLQKTGSGAIKGYDEEGFASDIENPEIAIKLYQYLQKTGSGAIKGYDEEGFISDMSVMKQQPMPTQPMAQQQTQQPEPTQQPSANTPNLQKVGKYGTKEFDSNTAQKITTDVDGNDILNVRTTDGMEHAIIRNPDNGTYDWYDNSKLNRDVEAAKIKQAAESGIDYEIQQRLSDGKPLRKFTATEGGKEKSGFQLMSENEEIKLQNTAYKKAAQALTRTKNADDLEIDNQSETERHATNIKTSIEKDTYMSDNTQSSVGEYKIRNNALVDETNNIGIVGENLQKALRTKYGQKYDDYLQFLETTAQSRMQDAKDAQQKGDTNTYNNIVGELNLMRDSFSDIENDDAFKYLGNLSSKAGENKARQKELLIKDNFKAAREVLDDERMLRNAKNFEGSQRKKEQDEEWNNGNYLSSIWNQTKQAVEYSPDVVAEAFVKVPKGLLNATTMLVDALPYSEGGKLGTLHAANNYVNREIKQLDDLSVIDDAFKNTNTYSVMKGLAELAPQAGLAMATGGAMTTLGLGAEAIGVTAFEITSQSIASMGFMAGDMYDANMEVLKDVEGMSDDERRRAASRLALFQSGAVGGAGAVLGGALGSAMNKSGILDGALGRWINSGAVSQAEMRTIFQRSAGLLKNGNVSAYLKETGKALNELFESSWRGNVAANLRGVAKSGGVQTFIKGGEEVIEENILEPIMQYTAEQTYALMGGDVEIQALYKKQDDEEAEMRKQSGRTKGDDYLSIFLVGAIAKGAGDLFRNGIDKVTGQDRRSDAMFNAATMAALKDLPNFQKELQRYKEIQLNGLEVGSVDYNKKKEVLDEIETNVNTYIEDVRNAGVKNKSGGISTWDVLSKQVDESKHENLVQLLSQRSVLNREAEILLPSKALQEAYRSDARVEGEKPPTISEAYYRKVQEIRANEEALSELIKTPKEVWQQRGKNVSAVYQKLFGGNQSINEIVDSEITNTQEKADDGVLSFAKIQETQAYQNASEDEKNDMAVRHDTVEGQKENAKVIISELKAKQTNSTRADADKVNLSDADLQHNTSIRDIGDNDNIVYRADRDYRNATQEEVDSVISGSVPKLTFQKGRLDSKKVLNAKQDSSFVVERKKDNKGNFQYRVFEKTENGYEVIHDNIGDKATLNSADKRNLSQKRYNNQISKAEAIRDRIVNESKDVNGNIDMKEVNDKLKNNKEYQKEISEAMKIQPSDNIFGRVVEFVKERVVAKKDNNVVIKKKVEQMISELKASKEVMEVEC